MASKGKENSSAPQKKAEPTASGAATLERSTKKQSGKLRIPAQLRGRDAQKIWDDHRNCRKPLQAKALISAMAYENHWLPGFNFNVEEWDAKGQTCVQRWTAIDLKMP